MEGASTGTYRTVLLPHTFRPRFVTNADEDRAIVTLAVLGTAEGGIMIFSRGM